MASEIETLVECVKVVTLGIMNVDGMWNPIKVLREAQGIHQFFENAKVEYADHPIVIEIIDTLEFLQASGVAEQIVGLPTQEQVMEQLAKADRVLAGKDDAQTFRNFLYQLAMTIANAHGKISEREREFLDMLKYKSSGKV